MAEVSAEEAASTLSELLRRVATGEEITITSNGEPCEYVPLRVRRDNIAGLPVTHAHTLHVATLPHHHGDPFDRLLVAQAQLEKVPLVTSDPQIERYDVQVIRAN